MKRIFLLWSGVAAFALALAGCGGVTIGEEGTAQISGNIIDINGNLVPNATITIRGKETVSNTAGAFVVEDIPEGVWSVVARADRDGVRYSGETVAQVFNLERTKSINITVVRESNQAKVRGIVRDRFGNVIQGARVFAYIEANGVSLSSVMDITNGLGEFDLNRLAAGATYVINGSARGYGSDRDNVILAPGETRQFDITLGDGFDPLFPPPGNISAVAWTTPREITRSVSDDSAYENLKRLVDPNRAQRAARTRSTINGNYIEVDVSWDKPTSGLSQLLGYGVYRANGVALPSFAVDYLRDPEVNFYADLSDTLEEFRTYYYELTALNSQYPNTGNSESDFSDRYGVATLGDLETLSPLFGPLTFRWTGTSGADQYYVYLFDRQPTIGVEAFWVNPTAVGGTSLVYSGPGLVSGRRYYYMVLGLANGGDSRTISRLGDFVAN